MYVLYYNYITNNMNRFIKIKNEEQSLNLINTLNEDHPSFVGKLRISKSAKILINNNL